MNLSRKSQPILVFLMCVPLLCLANSNHQNNLATIDYTPALMAHLKMLTSKSFNGRKVGTEGHLITQQYISSNLSTIQSTSKLFNPPKSKFLSQTFRYKKGFSKYKGENFIFIKYGNKFPNKFIVISAHYDHLGKMAGEIYPGANDNASGTSVLLTLKPWLSSLTTHHSIILLATDAEEIGLYGAKAFVTDSLINPEDIVLNINLDMVGKGVRKKSMYVAGLKRNNYLKDIIKDVNEVSNIEFIQKETLKTNNFRTNTRIDLHKASDHYEFYKKGIPYLFITGDNHKFYHTPHDNYANIEPGFYSKVFSSIQQLILSSDQYFTTLTVKSLL